MRFLTRSIALAAADLRHEKFATCCLFAALCAMFSPLMILCGLKSGVITTMRDRLGRNPSNLELIALRVPTLLDRHWFDKMRSRADTGFVIPQTKFIASEFKISTDKNPGDALQVYGRATALGDPLFLMAKAAVPAGGECALSDSAAARLGVVVGDVISAAASHIPKGGGARVTVALPLKVTAVLPKGSPVAQAIFVPLEIMEALEDFSEGRPVAKYGWTGTPDTLTPFYESLWVFSQTVVTPDEIPKLVPGSGYASSRPFDSEEYFPPGIVASPPPHWQGLALRTSLDSDPGYNRVERARSFLADHSSLILVPSNPPFQARLSPRDGAGGERTGTAHTMPQEARAVDILGLRNITPLPVREPPPGEARERPAKTTDRIVAVAPSVAREMNGQADFSAGQISGPVTLVPMQGLALDEFLVPESLSGIYRAGRRTAAVHDPATDNFVLARGGYARFRLYARSLDSVEPLQRALEAEGMEISSSLDSVRNIQFWNGRFGILLKVSLTVLGGAAMISLMSAMVASVDRKRYDMAVLRMIGLPRFWVASIPVMQSVILCLMAYAASFLVFDQFSQVLNDVFRARIESGEHLMRLTPRDWLTGLAAVLIMAGVSALAAAVRVLRISPAEALRSE